VLEIAVVVKDCCAVVLGSGGGEKVDDTSGAMLRSLGHRSLDSSRTQADLGNKRKIRETLSAACSDGAVLLR
jgi:hypothetical protein